MHGPARLPWPGHFDGLHYLLSQTQENNARRFVSIMPFIRATTGSYADKHIMKYSATFTDAEMQRVASVECTVVRDPGHTAAALKLGLMLFQQ